MIIKIRSKEEIKKTLKADGYHINGSGAYFANEMYKLCGESIKVTEYSDYFGYRVHSANWSWHPDWYEIIEPDLTQEDLFTIEELDEMLEFFLENY